MKFKNATKLVGAGVLSLGILAGCGGGEEEEAGVTEDDLAGFYTEDDLNSWAEEQGFYTEEDIQVWLEENGYYTEEMLDLWAEENGLIGE